MRMLVAALMLCAGLFCVPANAEESGIASVDYGRVTKFDAAGFHGRVATGERYRSAALAVAHRTLPLGSCVAIRHRDRIQIATVNDRGPCLTPHCQRVAPLRVKRRILDMTPKVASRIGCDGLCRVTVSPTPCKS